MRWFYNLSIGSKLQAGFALVVAILGLVGWIGYRDISTIAQNGKVMYVDSLEPIRDLGYANAALLIARGDMRNVMAAKTREEREKYAATVEEQNQKADAFIDKYSQLEMSTAEKDTLAIFSQAWKQYQGERAKATDLALNMQDAEAVVILDGVARDHLNIAMKSLRSLIDNNARTAGELQSSNEAAAKNAGSEILMFIGLGAGAAVVLGIFVARSISKPVKQMTAAAEKLALGDIDQHIEIDTKDEVGQLGASFRKMIEAQKQLSHAAGQIAAGNTGVKVTARSDRDVLSQSFQKLLQTLGELITETTQLVEWSKNGQLDKRGNAERFQGGFRDLMQGINGTLDAILLPVNEAAAVLEKLAVRDLTARVKGDYKGDHAKIKKALNQALDNLEDNLEHVSAGAQQVAAASSQINLGSQNLAHGASEQASSLEEVSSSLQEMSSMTKQNAVNAKEASSLSNSARTSAERGVDSMNRLSSAITKIKDSSDQTAKIVKTIDEIAFQTNLLALNAAVEAARAGDAGRGFAVVADEVRNLAIRSAEAAKNTAAMIETSVKNADGGVVINQEVLANLKEISEQVARVTDVVAEITAASDQQSQGIDQITTAVEQMNQVTQQTSANAEESASAAEELTNQSQEMMSLVSEFKLMRSHAAVVPGSARQLATTRQRSLPPPSPVRVVSDTDHGHGKMKIDARKSGKKFSAMHDDDDKHVLAGF